MNLYSDPQTVLIFVFAALIIGAIGFITGSVMRGIRAKQEQLRLWSQAESLYRARAVQDRRDDTPLPRL